MNQIQFSYIHKGHSRTDLILYGAIRRDIRMEGMDGAREDYDMGRGGGGCDEVMGQRPYLCDGLTIR